MDYKYFFIDDVVVDSVTLSDFDQYGKYKERYNTGEVKNLIVAAQTDKLEVNVISKDQVILSDEIDISGISKVKRIEINCSTNVKFLIGNGEEWFTYDQGWKKTDVEFIGTTGISAEVVSQIDNWEILNDKVSFAAFMGTESFEDVPFIDSISVTYDSVMGKRKRVHETAYDESNETDKIVIEWLGDDKERVQVIYG